MVHTNWHGGSNSEIEFSEDDNDIPEDRVTGGSWRKPMPSKLVIKAARAIGIPHRPIILGDCSAISGIFHHNTTNNCFLWFSLCRSKVLYMMSSKTKQEVQVATPVVAVGR